MVKTDLAELAAEVWVGVFTGYSKKFPLSSSTSISCGLAESKYFNVLIHH